MNSCRLTQWDGEAAGVGRSLAAGLFFRQAAASNLQLKIPQRLKEWNVAEALRRHVLRLNVLDAQEVAFKLQPTHAADVPGFSRAL